ncbi:MAG TPA: thiamine phosphate synthase [Thermomicrobiales bacterium]|nr:thiamine phosphate synthase [Thermomicrobiales bacterium]
MTVTRARLSKALRCYLVTDPGVESVERTVEICRQSIDGGVTAIQLRAKGWPDRRALEAALALRALCAKAGVLFLVNDRVDLALASDADGVHLGVEDLPVEVARRLLGEEAIIGYSPEGERDRAEALRHGADYLGVGPVYATATKADAGPALGVERFTEIVRSVDVPVIGIGGLKPDNARAVRDAGAAGFAVVSAIFYADDPAAAARAFNEVWQ